MLAVTPQQLNAYLKRKGSPMAGLGHVFVNAARKYNIDPRLLVAISGAESSFGTYGPSQRIHNPFGWGPHIPFNSWEDSINTVARGLYKGYTSQGLDTIPEIQRKWAPVGAGNDPTNLNSNWTRNVSKYYQELGGLKPVLPGGGAHSPAAKPTSMTGFQQQPQKPRSIEELTSSSGQFRQALMSALFSAAQNGGMMPPGTLLGLALARQNMKAAQDTFGDLPSGLGAEGGATEPTMDPGPRGPGPVTPGKYKGALAEAFYDPIGQWDNGRFSPRGIGNHSDHVHLSVTNPKAMILAIQKARQMGLRPGENPFSDPVDGNHVDGSFHYQLFPGMFQGRRLGKGLDVSGPSPAMAAYYRWALANLR